MHYQVVHCRKYTTKLKFYTEQEMYYAEFINKKKSLLLNLKTFFFYTPGVVGFPKKVNMTYIYIYNLDNRLLLIPRKN